jgi:RNA polymerase sigma-70 factor, ECF subfamily
LDAATTALLVARAKAGDGGAFAELARAFLRPAYAVALAVLGRPADAEDVAQEALVAALVKLETCREPERFAAWLLQIARNRAKNWRAHRGLREAGREEARTGLPPLMSEPVDPGRRARLSEALAALSEAQREVVLLHDLEGWTHGEIGASLGLSETMSRQHLFNARKALRAMLAGDAPSERGE